LTIGHCMKASRWVVEIGCIHVCGVYAELGRQDLGMWLPEKCWKESCIVERVSKRPAVGGRVSLGFVAFLRGGSGHFWKCAEYVDVWSSCIGIGSHSAISFCRCAFIADWPSTHPAFEPEVGAQQGRAISETLSMHGTQATRSEGTERLDVRRSGDAHPAF
jgi:hypothetical protein